MRLVRSLQVALLVAWAGCGSGLRGAGADLRERPIEVRTAWLFDVGVADVDADGDLDVYTVNHNAGQSLLLNQGQWRWREAASELGLDQDPSLPGWEVAGAEPAVQGPGLHLWHSGTRLVAAVAGDAPAVAGTLSAYGEVKVKEQRAASATTTGSKDAQGRPVTEVRFRVEGGGRVELALRLASLPLSVKLDAAGTPGTIHVGSRAVPVKATALTLRLQDRHGVAWSDVDADGRLDAFICRGGLKGEIEDYPGLVADELLLWSAGRYVDRLAGSGITKGTCRGRRAAWVDLDGDAWLDLSIGCLGEPLQLWRQVERGRFAAASDRVETAGGSADAWTWIDLDGDRRTELVLARSGAIDVHRRGPDGTFAVDQRLPFDGDLTHFSVSDFDGDGDPDLLAVSREAHGLLINQDGRLVLSRPGDLGLPGAGALGEWVDVDADGLVDLHAWPGGVFFQRADGRFEARGVLDREAEPQAEMRALWFDGDGDGDQDVLLALGGRQEREWAARLYENVGARGRGVTVDLRGPAGNAIALGAVVDIRTEGKTRRAWVGTADGSRFSQGHYRVFAGLGPAQSAEVTVRWPDGSASRAPAKSGSVVRVAHSGARP
jgi:hypothetical protein